jgi:hypothetical protein
MQAALFSTGLNLLPFGSLKPQPGFEQSGILGQRQFLPTEATHVPPPGGMGQMAPVNTTFALTTAEGPNLGWVEDGWRPMWSQDWVKAKAAKQQYEWNTLNVSSFMDYALQTNIGNNKNNQGAPYVLPTQKPEVHFPIVQVYGE